MPETREPSRRTSQGPLAASCARRVFRDSPEKVRVRLRLRSGTGPPGRPWAPGGCGGANLGPRVASSGGKAAAAAAAAVGGVERVEPAALAAAALAPQINILLHKQISREKVFEYNKISFIYNLLLFRQPQYTWSRVSELETHSPVRNKFSN